MAAGKKAKRAAARPRGAKKTAAPTARSMVESAQQIWLAGMGAIARTQKDNPHAFQEAVTEGVKLLDKSRATAEKRFREVFEAAQGSVQTRLVSAREQAAESWDNLEALFQGRVQKALQQLGVPNAEEVRLLTRRVAELTETVRAMTATSAPSRTKSAARRVKRAGGTRVARRSSGGQRKTAARRR
jgi:poly(hydroxyalkanoate) granule-associated protein